MRKLAAAVLAVQLAVPAGAADFEKASIGTTGGQLLQVDIGARGIGMGGAYSAVTNDAYSLYWNPAGLARIPRFSAGFMYTNYVAGINYQSASMAKRVNDTSVIAGGWRYLDAGLIPHTDISGNDRGTFRPRDYVAELGWGQSVYDLSDSEVDVNVGVSGRWLHSDYLVHADGYSGDIGMQARFYHGNHAYDFSFVAQNIGLGQSFINRRDTTPFQIRLGGGMQPIRSLTLAVEAVAPSNNVAYGAFGTEYAIEMTRNLKAALRFGFNSQTLEDLGAPTTLSCGGGLSAGNMSFDYAFVPFGILGDVHRFSISWNLPAKSSRRYRERD
jgi:hypothetical protein